MTPATTIISEFRAAGLTLRAEGDGIRVEPRSALTQELRARIIAAKQEILAALREGDADARHWRFRITPEGAAAFSVHTLPEATLDEARALWPGAQVEPLPDCDPASLMPDARSPADLLALVERVARAYRTSPDELAEMQRLALADPVSAWRAFTATAVADGIR